MRCLRFPAWCAAIFLLGGCAGYHLGPVNGETAGDKSVEVLPFNNQTLQPRLGDAVTQALREQLQVDATYHLAPGPGDIVLTGVVTSYGRAGLSYSSEDVLTASNYRINITAHVKARDSSTGKLLMDKDITGYTLVHVGTDLASAERQALPILAQDLAQRVTEQLAEGTW
jgi:hypothetical protein